MASLNEKKIETDILVVGSGGAGCFAAIKAQERGANVIIVNKVPGSFRGHEHSSVWTDSDHGGSKQKGESRVASARRFS